MIWYGIIIVVVVLQNVDCKTFVTKLKECNAIAAS
jgi:hypothetical protein